ncbi:unnamed protein product [Musa acuminata subsp. malaccensis]|uniref:(wild Malaysian banana) hypothetical protein n=1 Tax=Musa acuminata subsp. malaccensis TaxID=214687 RepID=A0A804J280_MUSAM|nr:unnamed protein product [Musa acuminata subsp. malaccensis]
MHMNPVTFFYPFLGVDDYTYFLVQIAISCDFLLIDCVRPAIAMEPGNPISLDREYMNRTNRSTISYNFL